MKRTPAALALLAVWVAALVLLGWFVQRQLVIGADLRLFLPNPVTDEQRLLLDEIGEGPASRVLVIALAGADTAELADVSRALVESLQESPSFRVVTNGEVSLDAVPDELLPYRFLLSPTLDTQPLDEQYLHAELQTRARDLASPAGAFLEPWLPRDPTLELLKLLQRWQPMQEPHREFDVWFDRAGQRALLLAITQAPAFDPDRQRLAIGELEQALKEVAGERNVTMTVSGAGKFSVLMEARTRGQAQAFGTAATVGMILLLLIAYRSPGSIVLSILPLASAGVAGMTAVSAIFGTVHGITLAFGFTLIGVAQDYPLHLLSHRSPDREPVAIARGLWPTLATGVASTCIAYLTFLFSGVTGLAQLACFTVVALAVAGATTRFALPALMDRTSRDFGKSPFLGRLSDRIAALPRMRWTALALAATAIAAVTLAPQAFWENDLSRLTPVPRELLLTDQQLRAELGTADARYLLVVSAPDAEEALRKLETLEPSLQELVSSGVIGGFDHAARYVPSAQTQQRRQQRLPDTNALREAVQRAQSGTPFRAGVFEPFVQDVEQARAVQPITVETVRSSPLGASVDMLLTQRSGGVTALVTLSSVNDIAPLQAFAQKSGDVRLLDIKLASEELVAAQRTRILWSLAAAAVLLIAVVAFALRSRSRALRVLAPMALTTLLVLAVLRVSGVSLNLFHLIALVLAAGLGLDYALFFEHAAAQRDEQRRTLHAVLVCSLSTLMVFALLGLSDIPVLRAIGVTVTLGVIFNFAFALLLTRPPADRMPSPAELIPHHGSMCLLERVVEWDDRHVVLETASHRSPTNPLRTNGRLRAVNLCEYGAQAMAVHGGLRGTVSGVKPKPGMLVSLRAVQFGRDYVEDVPGDLRVEAECLQADASSLQYRFKITHGEEMLAEGRAAVVLSP